MINRSQGLVLGFMAASVLGLIGIFALDPAVYTTSLPVPQQSNVPIDLAFLAALITFIAVVGIGVIRRWRWLFWLVQVAFLAGFLRLPASTLQLLGVLPTGGPSWYIVLQGMIGLVQFAIGLALLSGYRKGGVWGAF